MKPLRVAPGAEATSSERSVHPLRTSPVAADSRVRRARAGDGADRRGPDIGLVLACAGLLLAAGVLGLTDDGRRRAASTRSKLRAALPAFGRR